VKRYWLLMATIVALFLTTYLLVEALGVRPLTDPAPWLRGGGLAGAALGVLLLIADQFIPVPSSLVMISLGAMYGAPAGIVLSLVGRVGMAAAGFAIGRAGGPLLDRMIPTQERGRVDSMLRRWGALAVLVSRPIPLLAETVAIMAGASTLRWGAAMLAATIGSAPEAIAYGLAGSMGPSFENVAIIWGSFLLLAGGFWLLGRRIDRRATTTHRAPHGVDDLMQ
jgi:uncharacterized membrane protein YdjX (TVP38/TMEM64 family)